MAWGPQITVGETGEFSQPGCIDDGQKPFDSGTFVMLS
jgi:hypothetical protein